MYMTFFDSKRYYSAEKFSSFYATRKNTLPLRKEDDAKYHELFNKQSVRYVCGVVNNQFEEWFLTIDGKGITLRQPLVERSTYETYLSELLSFYGYAFGGVLTMRPTIPMEEILQGALLVHPSISYEQGTLVYRKEEKELYIAIALVNADNFALRIFEKEDYEPFHKEELLQTIEKLLCPLLKTNG